MKEETLEHQSGAFLSRPLQARATPCGRWEDNASCVPSPCLAGPRGGPWRYPSLSLS